MYNPPSTPCYFEEAIDMEGLDEMMKFIRRMPEVSPFSPAKEVNLGPESHTVGTLSMLPRFKNGSRRPKFEGVMGQPTSKWSTFPSYRTLRLIPNAVFGAFGIRKRLQRRGEAFHLHAGSAMIAQVAL
ncbi:hypothetical protein BYT27DRAFT_7258719 [Phlegmacium glaucopus]|nr:hypothetical protein BYT27DRAFT_7258719 [Phlegmacium glaucopus]